MSKEVLYVRNDILNADHLIVLKPEDVFNYIEETLSTDIRNWVEEYASNINSEELEKAYENGYEAGYKEGYEAGYAAVQEDVTEEAEY